MRNTVVKCVILGHKNFGEADRFIFLYCDEFGKTKAVAKGARKITSKFMGYLETLNVCFANLYFGPNNIIITEISQDEDSRMIKENLETLSGALQIAEITSQLLPENQPLDNLLKLIEKTLKHLTETKKPELIAIAYIVKLLDKTGLLPDFKTTKVDLSTKYLKFLEYLKKESLTDIEKIKLTKIEQKHITEFLKRWIEQETNKSFKSFF